MLQLPMRTDAFEADTIVVDLLAGIAHSKTTTLVIKTNFLGLFPYPHTTDITTFSQFVTALRKKYSGTITLLEAEFADIAWSTSILADNFDLLFTHKLTLAQANKEIRHRISSSSHTFFLPKTWSDADIRISFTPAVKHIHHHNSWVHAGIYNVGTLLTENDENLGTIPKSTHTSLLETSFSRYYNAVLASHKQYPFYSVIDAREIGLTDAHDEIPQAKKGPGIFFGNDPKSVDTEFTASLV